MAFIGTRAFLERTLDDLWQQMCELEVELITATPERRNAIEQEYAAFENEYHYYFKCLQECEIPWWKS